MLMRIALVPGDGIGPDIVGEAVKVLGSVGKKFKHKFDFSTYLAGGIAIDATGGPLPESTLLGCQDADAVLLGAVGGPKWDNWPVTNRPRRPCIGLRGGLGLFCNLRPALLYPQLAEACPLKSELIEGGWISWWCVSSPVASTSATVAATKLAMLPTIRWPTPKRKWSAFPGWHSISP